MKKILIYDSTLRDSDLAPGFGMTLREREEAARQIERLGADIIDAGEAGISDAEGIARAATAVENAIVSVTVKPDEALIREAEKLTRDASKRRVNLIVRSWAAPQCEELEKLVKLSVALFGDVQLTAMMSRESDEESAFDIAVCAQKSGAKTVCLKDSFGMLDPAQFANVVKKTVAALPGIIIAASCKNDLGMATANMLSALAAGATELQCSVCGIGSRAGGAAVEELVAAIEAKKDYYNAKTCINKRQLYRTARLISALTGYPIPGCRPVVGDNALVYPDEAPLRVVKPEDVGVIRNNLVLGKHSSMTAFEERVSELGYYLSPEQVKKAFDEFKTLLGRKKTVHDRDIEVIAQHANASSEQRFELVNFVINSGTMFPSTSTVILKVDGKEVTKVAMGSGPVDAAFKAIDRILKMDVTLEDFSLQSVTEGEDALGDASVKVSSNGRIITGRGVSTDIVEASIRAYISALNKAAAVLGA